MNQAPILGVGRSVSTTVGSGAQVLFAEADGGINAVWLTNHHATKTLWVSCTTDFASVPTMSATQHDIPLPADSFVEIKVAKNIAIWVRSEDTTTINYSAKEVKT